MAEVGVFAVSVGAQTAAAVGRASLVAAAAIGLSGWLSAWMAGQTRSRRMASWIMLLLPFFTPPLLISYAFSKFALALVASPWSHQALYISILALKLTPVAVILRLHLPSPLAPEAWHIYRALGHGNRWRRLRFRLDGAGEGPWIAGGLVFLLAFADFELASLWNIHTWTIAIFDAQIGGLALAETLGLAIWPLGVALATVIWIVRQGARLPLAPRPGRVSGATGPWGYLALAALVVSLTPLAIVLVQAIAGWRSLMDHFVLGPEIGVSLALGLAAAIVADIGVRILQGKRAVALAAAAPGLLGALTLSLLILALFQVPGLHRAYDTPLPLVLALSLLILPLGLLLAALRPRRTPALHIARAVGSRRLWWDLEARPRLIASGLLFCWAYCDFTAGSILAPVGLTPVFVRLHNLAHYGQNAVLSAMILAAFAAPVVVLLLTGTALHLYARRDGR